MLPVCDRAAHPFDTGENSTELEDREGKAFNSY